MPRQMTTSDFIRKAVALHGSFYDYSAVDYHHSKVHVEIGCPIHGPFTQRPNDHLSGKHCRHCARKRTADAHRRPRPA